MRDERHRYGQHYTPPDVARLLAAFAVRSPADTVFDPSCGDGRLLAEAMIAKRKVDARSNREINRDVFGLDRSHSAIELAAQTGAQAAVADFFDVEPGARLNDVNLPNSFDAIIGNPPYIRQEVIGKRDKRRIEARLAKDRETWPEVFWPRWSGRSDIYVYFFAHAICFLKERGRLVFLTASSWLDAGYGAALREFLLNNFRIIAIIESAAESFFVDASINTSITVLERESDARARTDNSIRFVRLNRPLSAMAEISSSTGTKQIDRGRALANRIERENHSITTDAYVVRIVEQTRLMACKGRRPWPLLTGQGEAIARTGGHGGPHIQSWGKYLRADDVFFLILERGRALLQPLSGLARVRFGVKTGANDFFYVNENRQKDSERGEGGKGKGQSERRSSELSSVASVRRGLTTGANDFFYLTRSTKHPTPNRQPPTPSSIAVIDSSGSTRAIESRFLTPVIFSLKEISGIVLNQVEGGKLFFHCSANRDELTGSLALKYIRSGERAGYDSRPSCAARQPWYSVANGRKPAPLIFPSKVGERWLVALNRAGVFEDKKLYGIFPARGVSALVLAALLNSTWARYYAEITCRQMTGAQAIADIDVAVAEQIMIPDPRTVSLGIKKKLEAAVLELSRRPVYSVFQELKRTDRRRLDLLTLEAIGFARKLERDAVLDQLYKAVTDLVRGRISKSTRM
jgi:hypothetical protein